MNFLRTLFSPHPSSIETHTLSPPSAPNTALSDNLSYTPYLYRECRTYEQKVQWVQSEYGQQVLSKRPVLQEYYRTGQLMRMFKNKHWDIRLEEWLTLRDERVEAHVADIREGRALAPSSSSSTVPFGLNLPLTEEEKEKLRNDWLIPMCHHKVPLVMHFKPAYEAYSQCTMPLENKLHLITEGYTILHNIIPLELIDIANETMVNEILPHVDMSFLGHPEKLDPLQRNQDPYFLSGTTNHVDLLNLFYCSPLVGIVESILYKESKRQFKPLVHGCQVAYRFSRSRPLHHHYQGKLGGKGWHIDGLDKGKYGSFSFLIGIPLNNQQGDFSGNLCLHPGSHYTLQSYMKAYANASLSANNENERMAVPRAVPRPDLGEPVQVHLNAGDVVIALHKVAHRGGPNYSAEVRKMLYFRVSHERHGEVRIKALDDMWLEYEGLHDLVYG